MEGMISPPINYINADQPLYIPQVHAVGFAPGTDVSDGGFDLQRNHDLESRRKRPREQEFVDTHSQDAERDGQKGMPLQHAKMRVPRLNDSLSWGKHNVQNMSVKDAGVSKSEKPSCESDGYIKPRQSANHLAAKVLQLRMKGKHEEAEKLLKEAEGYEGKSKSGSITANLQDYGTTSRYIMHNIRMCEKKKEEDADMHVAQLIMQNRRCSISAQADDEYDYDKGANRRKRGKCDDVSKSMRNTRFAKHILTQQEC